jgi:hypothetical protein
MAWLSITTKTLYLLLLAVTISRYAFWSFESVEFILTSYWNWLTLIDANLRIPLPFDALAWFV